MNGAALQTRLFSVSFLFLKHVPKYKSYEFQDQETGKCVLIITKGVLNVVNFELRAAINNREEWT